MIVECKAPQVAVTQKVFDQIMVYDIRLSIDYLIVSNDLQHFCCKFDQC